MAVRKQIPERGRSAERNGSAERERLYALTQPVPAGPVATGSSAAAGEPSVAPDVPVHRWVPERAADPCTGGAGTAAGDLAPGAADPGVADPAAADPDAGTCELDASGREADLVTRDAADVAARRSSALAAASKAYADAHGHPLTHPRDAERRPGGAPRRWGVPLRLALTAALAMGLVGGAVALRSASVASAGLEPVELPPVGASLPSPGAGAEGTPGAAPTAGAPTDLAATGDAGPASAAATGGPGSASAAGPGGGTVVVHVVGQVMSPGVVELAGGARVDDAIRAAGGATARADLAALNLARVVIDGEQVVVPAPGEVVARPPGQPAGTAVGGTGQGASSAAVDLNGADAAALDALPGIGPVLAGRIVDWRQANGRFASVEQLGEVDGIGPALLAKLRALVRV